MGLIQSKSIQKKTTFLNISNVTARLLSLFFRLRGICTIYFRWAITAMVFIFWKLTPTIEIKTILICPCVLFFIGSSLRTSYWIWISTTLTLRPIIDYGNDVFSVVAAHIIILCARASVDFRSREIVPTTSHNSQLPRWRLDMLFH